MPKRKATKFYERIFRVEGTWEFPMDMLRYDSCFPATERDSHVAQDHGRRGKRSVTLVQRSPADRGPTGERWASFGWQVVTTDLPTFYDDEGVAHG